MVHYAKPGNEPAYSAEYNPQQKGWQVVTSTGQLAIEGVFPTRCAAAAYAGRRNKEVSLAAKRRDRPCMCCTKPFASEGIHNRLCPDCRLRGSAEAMPAGYSYGSMTGRRKSA